MRKYLLLLSILSLPCISIAQANSNSWTNLNSLQTGKKIQIIDTSSKKYSGTLINVSDASIAFVPKDSAQQTLQRSEVRTVKVSSGKRRMINTLVVGGIGAGIGAAVFAATNGGCSTPGWCFVSRGEAAGIGAVLGAVPGVAIGALLPARDTVYNVK